MSTRRPCCPLTWTERTAPQSRNYRPQSQTCGWWSTGLQAWRSLFGSGVSRSRAGRAQPPHAIAARSCGAGTSSGGSTLGGWTSTKRCGDQGRGPLFRLKGSALRHSVDRLVLDTVFVTFGMQWAGVSSTRFRNIRLRHAKCTSVSCSTHIEVSPSNTLCRPLNVVHSWCDHRCV